MTTVLFVHSAGLQGPGEGSNRLLLSLREKLPPGFDLIAPLMPAPDAPTAERWKAATRDAMSAIDGDLVLLGHSLGGSTLLQVIAEHGLPPNVRGLVLLAVPFWSARDWNVAEFALPQDAEDKLAKLDHVVLLQGDQDDVVPADHPDRYLKLMPAAQFRSLPGIDHEAADAADAVLEAVRDVL